MNALHIVIAVKPIEGNYAENAVERGVVGLNIDGTRIGTGEEDLGDASRFDGSYNHVRAEWHRPHMTDDVMSEKKKATFEKLKNLGRWPANIMHDGSDEVIAQFPDSMPSGSAQAGKPTSRKCGGDGIAYNIGVRDSYGIVYHNDRGSAARFFKEFSDES